MREEFVIKPDYTRTVQEVYTMISRSIIHVKRSLGPIHNRVDPVDRTDRSWTS